MSSNQINAPGKPIPRKIRVFIVDDHPMLREGLKAVINQQPDMVACGEAATSAEALSRIDRCQPGILLVDLSLKDSNGLDLLKDLQIRWPNTPALVLSMHDEMFYAERALHAGARGFVAKEQGTERVIEAIRQVVRGEPYLSPSVTAKILSKTIHGSSRNHDASPESLSDRELQVLELIGSGYASGEIAEKLHLSVKTIESHRENIKQKLQLTSGSQLVKYAFSWMQHRALPGPGTLDNPAQGSRNLAQSASGLRSNGSRP